MRTRRTEEQQKELYGKINYLKGQGLTVTQACKKTHVNAKTYYQWGRKFDDGAVRTTWAGVTPSTLQPRAASEILSTLDASVDTGFVLISEKGVFKFPLEVLDSETRIKNLLNYFNGTKH